MTMLLVFLLVALAVLAMLVGHVVAQVSRLGGDVREISLRVEAFNHEWHDHSMTHQEAIGGVHEQLAQLADDDPSHDAGFGRELLRARMKARLKQARERQA